LRASRRAVTLGSEQSKQTVVISGIEVGEQIATNGSFKLSDGMLTYVNEAAKPAGAIDGAVNGRNAP